MTRWLWLSLIVILLDQTSKMIVEAMFTLGETLYVLPFLDLTLRTNPGAAFSFLSEQGGWQRWFFIVLALVVTVVMVTWLSRLKYDEKWTAVSLSLIVGGAIGNVIDRMRPRGEVIDFIVLHYQEYQWPAFNIADSAIFMGVAIMLFDAFVLARKRQ
ncbi:MAG: signal peptidase II [Candidatus Thiodiazotropha sp. (ex Monitilora ramsayi)]|nr:signal peptidase II [Candidatus Thiodiazotropha sp. (ex Monitilora ramsayi)]